MKAIDTTGGFVAVYRSLLDHPLMNHLPAAWFRIFVAILLKVNWKPAQWFDGTKHVNIAPGSMVTSLANLGQMAHSSVKQVRGCLRYLQKAQIAEVIGAHQYTIITILNWSIYQNLGDSGGTAKRDGEGKPRAQSGQTKGTVGATIEQGNKETRKQNCFSAGFTGEGFASIDKRFSAYEPQKPRFTGGDLIGVSETELQSQSQSQNLSVKESQKQSQNQPLAEISRDSLGETVQDSPKVWSASEQAAVRARVCRLLPIEPEEGFEISLWYRVNYAPAALVCDELDRLYAKSAYRHPRGRYRLHYPNGILETLGNILVGYHSPEPPARSHADHLATAEQMMAGIDAIELADASAAGRGTGRLA